MKRVLSYNEFVNESKDIKEGITNIKGIMSNPIKYKKIKNNAKVYQKTKVQQALNNLDYEKKKAASKGDGNSNVLKVANATKNASLKDKSTAIASRMKDLATTDPLKKVVTLATSKANLAAAETALKAADAEETKALKIRIKKLAGQAADAQKALKDYESDSKEDTADNATPSAEDNQKAAAAEKTKLDKEKADKEKEAAKANKVADKKDEPKVDDTAKDKIAQLEGKIKAQDKIQADATKNIEKLKGELKLAQDNKNTGKSSQAEVDAISAKIQQETEDKKAAKAEEDKLKKQLKPIADKQYGESHTPLEESVADKFRRLSEKL
tara:strand:- start:1921 stop:2895 length:975 start_codon:yes stop_codon:yes gene_type:complete